MQIRCFNCPMVMTVTTNKEDKEPFHVALCSECCHERGITPSIADKLGRIDASFQNPACIWEATTAEQIKWMWECAVTDCDDGSRTEDGVEWVAARRVVHALNVLWFGSEVLIR